MNALERAIVKATQEGLPLCERPYAELASRLGIPEADILACVRAMLADGRIRRIGAVPNHYRLGWTANAMTVWDVDDEALASLGPRIGSLDFVSHCYRRPRRPPVWRYNLFAMVHGRDKDETAGKIESIRSLLGSALAASEVLYSRRILKKTGLRIA